MDLHCLDLGIARFMEYGVIMMISEKLDPDHLQACAVELLRACPILNRRLDILRGVLIENKDDEVLHRLFWRSKIWSYSLGDVLPPACNGSGAYTTKLDIESLLAFPNDIGDLLRPPVLSIKAAFLDNACLLAFYVQHPLCDADGLRRIIDTYTSLVAGQSFGPILPRCSIVLKDKDYFPETSDVRLSTSTPPDTLAQLQLQTVLVGWKPLIRAGIKQIFSRSHQVQSSYLVSSSVIKGFRSQARENGQIVTLNDILMAFIWKASTASQISRQDCSNQTYPSFSFVLNIRRQIKHDTDLHNPWVIIQVPNPRPNFINSESVVQGIIDLAAHIRETIRQARTTDCLRPIIDHHKSALGKPLTLDTKFLATSWSHICLYKTEFQVGKNPAIQPEYVQPFVRMPGLFQKLGMRVENTVVTSQDSNGGFWIQGNLEEVVWRNLASIASIDK